MTEKEYNKRILEHRKRRRQMIENEVERDISWLLAAIQHSNRNSPQPIDVMNILNYKIKVHKRIIERLEELKVQYRKNHK